MSILIIERRHYYQLGKRGTALIFAKTVFTVAGILGIIQLLPLYFLVDFIGRRTPPGISHPEYYFGFAGVALAWQIVFLMIGKDPQRYRAVMVPSILEKASWVLALVVLSAQHRIGI